MILSPTTCFMNIHESVQVHKFVKVCLHFSAIFVHLQVHTSQENEVTETDGVSLKEIGKEIYLNIFESIQGVVMNAHKNPTQRALLCVIHSFLSPL